MRCAWQALLNLIPLWMRETVDKQGRDSLKELRLRLNAPPLLITKSGQIALNRPVTEDDLCFIVNVASRYSPWSSTTIENGYITAHGGHRVGICGVAIISKGSMTGVKHITSLCIRVARDFPGIGKETIQFDGSILIIGKPGSGKTTLLRDIIRQRSNRNYLPIAVVDEREEIFPISNNQLCFPIGRNTDVLSGCRKPQGIDAVLRNMSPATIAVDEITAKEKKRPNM